MKGQMRNDGFTTKITESESVTELMKMYQNLI